jgi:uncharacterized protein (DUF427 family)
VQGVRRVPITLATLERERASVVATVGYMSSTSEAVETRGRVRIEHGEKRVRAYLGGELVADTINPVLVWEVPYYPTYYLPLADVRAQALEQEDAIAHSPSRGDARTFTLNAGGKRAAAAALRYVDSPIEELRDLIRFDWDAIDAWFEEDEEVFTHARNPHTRVDILASSRHVLVQLASITIAESPSPRLVFETGLPARYYLPKTHVRMDLLVPTDIVTHCPYKGAAQAWSARVGDDLHENIAWCYPTPLRESQAIAGLISFYSERVELYVDGVLQQRPATKAS